MNNFTKSAVLLLISTIIGIFLFTYQDSIFQSQAHPETTKDNNKLDFTTDVQPILAQRCVVCHACYDAPCQLKLGSYEGITRGANKERVYDGERLLEANLTRLFEDAHTTKQWRERDFFAVIAEQLKTAKDKENAKSNVFAELLALKQAHPLPKQALLPEQFELDINQSYQCPTGNEINDYKKDYSLMGMPYGLPKLSQDEHALLNKWLQKGAKGNDDILLSGDTVEEIEQWEEFLNQADLKSQLMSRYLFEHLFLVHLYFESDENPQFFKLVRSVTGPGEPVQGIYKRRPFSDPEVERVFYRLIPVQETLVHKAHMPVALSEQRLDKWKAWFITPDYQVKKLPSYLPEEASNPFITFAQIPVKSRYQYMLDESQNTIMQFIKGPVCRGQMALNVINDHFWVLFVDPDNSFVENDNGFLQAALQNIALPAEEESTALPTAWISYAAQEREYLTAKSAFIEKNIANKVPITLDLLWDGEGKNDNLALTVFRHNDAATVVKGLVGKSPQTAWVLTYPLFERIHYLLVAGYDVYGNLGHQLNSRMYMDFLRMEGEFNFLSFLPKEARKQARGKWYRGSVSSVEDFVYQANTSSITTDIEYKTKQPLTELYGMLKSKVAPSASAKHELKKGFTSKKAMQALMSINQLTGNGIANLPESAIVQIYNESSDKQHFYTLLRHSAHTNISHLFDEEDRRLPSEDTITIASGFMTSHPNAFMRVKENQLSDFAYQLQNLRTASDYTKLMDNFGIRRTSEEFWSFADNMHSYFKANYPIEFGYLDFNRLENR